jgi:hypothetical protein
MYVMGLKRDQSIDRPFPSSNAKASAGGPGPTTSGRKRDAAPKTPAAKKAAVAVKKEPKPPPAKKATKASKQVDNRGLRHCSTSMDTGVVHC